MRNDWDRVVERIKTHILYSRTFTENRSVYEIIWGKKNGSPKQATDGSTMRRMRFACRATTANIQTHTLRICNTSFSRAEMVTRMVLFNFVYYVFFCYFKYSYCYVFLFLSILIVIYYCYVFLFLSILIMYYCYVFLFLSILIVIYYCYVFLLLRMFRSALFCVIVLFLCIVYV